MKPGRWIAIAALSLTLSACSDAPVEPPPSPPDLLERLNDLPGVVAVEIEPQYEYPRAFQIDITQPVDHADPQGAQFSQRMFLSHVDEQTPMVFAPGGYAATERSGQEIAGILRTNCLNVTHRYFDGARPEPTDWQYLTIEQSAADHHRIVETFKEIYGGVWLSAGVSKSGLTSLFHRRYYPDDVTATVAYVAPFLFSTEDPRFADFLETLGDEVCRQKIRGFQRQILENHDSMMVRFSAWFEDNGYVRPAETLEAFEGAVRSYDWTFWQYTDHDCDAIPAADASYDEMIAHLDTVVRFSRMTDEYEAYMRPWVYQAHTQIGYPERRYGYLEDLFLGDREAADSAYFAWYGIDIVYRPESILDIYDWLRTEGDNVIYIYGGNDPWTAGEIDLTNQVNALKVTQPGANHRVGILDLDEEALVLQTLSEWLGVQIQAAEGFLSILAGLDSDFLLPDRR